MSNYRVNRDMVLNAGPWPISATGAASDGEAVFLEFREAKAAAIEIIDVEMAALKRRRAAVRAMKPKDANLED